MVVVLEPAPPPTRVVADVVVTTALGQSVETPLRMKNIPIKVLGKARVPLHALLMRSVKLCSSDMQLDEQAWPLRKSWGVQLDKGVS